jgi:hypothetical protein
MEDTNEKLPSFCSNINLVHKCKNHPNDMESRVKEAIEEEKRQEISWIEASSAQSSKTR